MCFVGDAILTGVAGEHWPIARLAFEDSYQAMLPAKMGDVGTYCKRSMIVEARCVTHTEAVVLPNGGVLSAKPGDWIVTGPQGDDWVVEASVFAKTYEAVHINK